MDLAIIEERIKQLRARREFLPEIRDYKPQRGKAKTAPVEQVSLPVDDTFGGFFKEEDTSDGQTNNSPDAVPSAEAQVGSDPNGLDTTDSAGGEPRHSDSENSEQNDGSLH